MPVVFLFDYNEESKTDINSKYILKYKYAWLCMSNDRVFEIFNTTIYISVTPGFIANSF